MSWNDLRKGRFSEPNREYFITFVCRERKRFFDDHKAAAAFCSGIKLNESNTESKWLAWVLMPDHFHGLLALSEKSNLSEVIKDIKGRSSRMINKASHSNGRVWQSAFYDRALRFDEDRLSVARYIVANPLRARLVRSVRDYPYWDSIYL